MKILYNNLKKICEYLEKKYQKFSELALTEQEITRIVLFPIENNGISVTFINIEKNVKCEICSDDNFIIDFSIIKNTYDYVNKLENVLSDLEYYSFRISDTINSIDYLVEVYDNEDNYLINIFED